MKTTYHICLLPGDGIGIEVLDASLAVLDALQTRFGFSLAYDRRPGGALHYRDTGDAFPDSSMAAAKAADAILFGAMGWPEIRYADGTEIAPQLALRETLDLYAGVRPIRAIPGVPLPLGSPRAKDIDFVIVRESTEGWFHARQASARVRTPSGGEAVQDTAQISRKGCERLFDFSFRLAEKRKARNTAKGKVTCVDKSNVFRGMAFMNAVFRERAAHFPAIIADHCYIDAYCLNLIRRPWDYDVCPMENQFGDITSDLGAGLIGGMGYAPSADLGDHHGLFQPAHGTAPDIAGQGIANPTAMILSAAMMLEWLGDRYAAPRLSEAALVLEQAVDAVFAQGAVKPFDVGGKDGTAAIARAVIEQTIHLSTNP